MATPMASPLHVMSWGGVGESHWGRELGRARWISSLVRKMGLVLAPVPVVVVGELHWGIGAG